MTCASAARVAINVSSGSRTCSGWYALGCGPAPWRGLVVVSVRNVAGTHLLSRQSTGHHIERKLACEVHCALGFFDNPRFSAMLRPCRCPATKPSLSLGLTVACWEVSISAPSGHLSQVSTSQEWIFFYEDVETATERLRNRFPLLNSFRWPTARGIT
jgi:hypothetical protein